MKNQSKAVEPEKRGKPLLILAGLFVVALLVRILYLGRADLWCDEILYVWLSDPDKSPWGVITNQWASLLSVTHLPLPEVVQNIFMQVRGGEFAELQQDSFFQRLPAVLWGAFSVPVFFLFSNRVSRKSVAWAATLMMCFFLFPVYYAREAYFYAPLIFFSSATLYFYARALMEERMSNGQVIGFVLAATGMVYSHLSGIALFAILFLVILVWFVFLRLRKKDNGTTPSALNRLVLFSLVPILAISPFVLRLALNKVTSGMTSGTSVWLILYDVLGKVFMGSLTIPNILACLLFVLGLVYLCIEKNESTKIARRLLAVAALTGTVVLAISANKTQYSSRYFSAMIPLFYILYAEGLAGVVDGISRLNSKLAAKKDNIIIAVAVLLVLLQAIFFLPSMYRLESKAVDFGGMAEWLNEHLDEGEPYLMESGYELRFVSGYFPTPELVPACPYMHGGWDPELVQLHAVQQDFMLRFPEAPFVESAHHNYGTPKGLWMWPHQYYKQQVQLRNEPLRAMIRRGIYPALPGAELTDVLFVTDIFYNTPEDVETLAREAGRPVVITYPGWRCVPYERDPRGQATKYARFAQGSKVVLTVKNLTGNSVKGSFNIQGLLAGPQKEFEIQIGYAGHPVQAVKRFAGQLWQLQTNPINVQPGITILEFTIFPGNQIQGLLLRDVQFVKSGTQ